MRPVLYGLLSAIWLGASPPVCAVDVNLGTCAKSFTTSSTGTGVLELSEKPSKLCSFDCLTTAANGWAVAWDTPDTDGDYDSIRHTQAVVKAEKGSASSGESTGTGETARYTDFGLLIETSGCIATGTWQD